MRESLFKIAFVVELMAGLTSASASHAQDKGPDVGKRVDDARVRTPPRLVIGQTDVMLDGRRVADTQGLAADERTERIEPMIQDLALRAGERPDSNRLVPLRAEVEVADAIPFRVVRKLLFSLAQAGYEHVTYVSRNIADQLPRLNTRSVVHPVLLLHADGCVFYAGGTTPTPLVKDGERYDDAGLRAAFLKYKKARPRDDLFELAPDDEVSFEDVAAAMTIAKEAGFLHVSLTAGIGGSARSPRPMISSRGHLSKAVIRSAVDRGLSKVRSCYERFLDSIQDLPEATQTASKTEGRVRVKFIIEDTGAVVTAAVVDSDIDGVGFQDCVVQAVRGLAFPAPEGGGVVVVTFPFVFGPEPEQ